MSGETTITIIGNLVADPEPKDVNKSRVVNFSVATRARVYSRQSGSWDDGPTSYFDCEIWNQGRGREADNMAQSLRKGSRVIVCGTLQQVSWTTQQGENRKRWVVRVDELGVSIKFNPVGQEQQLNFGGEDPWAAPAGAQPPF